MKRILLALILALSAPLALAQTVQFGGTHLELGSPRSDTLALANARFELVPSSRRGQYMVYPRQALGEAGLGVPLGSITFDNDQLVRISRNLGSFQSEAGVAAIESLISAFASAPRGGEMPSVRTDADLDRQASTSRVYFSYPDRAIQVVIFRPPDLSQAATVHITEQFALPGSGPAVPDR